MAGWCLGVPVEPDADLSVVTGHGAERVPRGLFRYAVVKTSHGWPPQMRNEAKLTSWRVLALGSWAEAAGLAHAALGRPAASLRPHLHLAGPRVGPGSCCTSGLCLLGFFKTWVRCPCSSAVHTLPAPPMGAGDPCLCRGCSRHTGLTSSSCSAVGWSDSGDCSK